MLERLSIHLQASDTPKCHPAFPDICSFGDYSRQVLVYDGAKMGGINYANLEIETDKEVTQARESVRVTNDAKVVGNTYRFVNNDGSADKRFNNNTEIPLIEFAVLKIGGSGLNLLLFVSNQHHICFES